MTVAAREVVGKCTVLCAENASDEEMREFYNLAKNKFYYREVSCGQ